MAVISRDRAFRSSAAHREPGRRAAVRRDDLDGMLSCGQGIQKTGVQRDRQRFPGDGIFISRNDLSVHEDAQQIILCIVCFEGQGS